MKKILSVLVVGALMFSFALAADFTDVAYYDSVNNQLTANSSMFWQIADNTDIAGLFT